MQIAVASEKNKIQILVLVRVSALTRPTQKIMKLVSKAFPINKALKDPKLFSQLRQAITATNTNHKNDSGQLQVSLIFIPTIFTNVSIK